MENNELNITCNAPDYCAYKTGEGTFTRQAKGVTQCQKKSSKK